MGVWALWRGRGWLERVGMGMGMGMGMGDWGGGLSGECVDGACDGKDDGVRVAM